MPSALEAFIEEIICARRYVPPCADDEDKGVEEIIDEIRLRNVRLHELLHSERARLSRHIFLGDPHHDLSECGWAKTEVRLATDGHGYTFREFEEAHGEWATWCWERSTVLNPVSGEYLSFCIERKQACHRALLRILRNRNDCLKARKVLTNPRSTVHVLPGPLRQFIATFITIDKEAVKAMAHTKRTLVLKNMPLARVLIPAPPTNSGSGSGDGASS